MKTNIAVHYRVPMLIVGFISLIFGMVIGLAHMGLSLPYVQSAQRSLHAPLMICGFLGTVISLERAVAIGERWAYMAPLISATAAVALMIGLHVSVGAILATLASFTLCIVSLNIFLRQRELFTFTLFVAALCWLIGCIFWQYGFTIAHVTPWWMGFLIITIVGERLELSRFMRPTRGSKVLFIIALVLFLAGASFASLHNQPDYHLLSSSLILMTLWLIRNDIVRHTIQQNGLTRYIAVALSCGYVWLISAGIIGLSFPQLLSGSSYDAFSHAIFIGFVFSMIFGHAPIIFPAITKIKIAYHPSFYLPLILLQLSLLLRLSADFIYLSNLRISGGLLHAVSIITFILVLAMRVKINNKNIMK